MKLFDLCVARKIDIRELYQFTTLDTRVLVDLNKHPRHVLDLTLRDVGDLAYAMKYDSLDQLVKDMLDEVKR